MKSWLGRATLAGGLVVLCGTASAQQMFSGITEAASDLTLSLTVAGRVDGIAVKEGDRVAKAAVILHLDKTLEELEVERRQLALGDRSGLEAAQRREQTLRAQSQGSRRLLDTHSVARKQVEDEELAYNAAVAERRSLEVAERRERIELDLAREALARRILRAPAAGTIVKLYRHEGESIGAHEPVVKLVDTSECRFVGNVDDSVGQRIRVGTPVMVRVGADPGVVRPAKVVFVSPVADPASGLVEVKAVFDNADGAVRPGTAGHFWLAEPEKAAAVGP